MKTMQHPVPREILTAIGDITVSFAMLESHMQNLASWIFPTNDRIPNVVTSFLSFKNLVVFLEGIYLERLGKNQHYENLKTLLIEAKRLETLRNQITHSVWGEAENGKSVKRIKHTCRERRGLDYQFQHMSCSDFETIATDMKVLAWKFYEFMIFLTSSGIIATPGK